MLVSPLESTPPVEYEHVRDDRYVLFLRDCCLGGITRWDFPVGSPPVGKFSRTIREISREYRPDPAAIL